MAEDKRLEQQLSAAEIKATRSTMLDGGELCPSISGELAVLDWDDYTRLLSMLQPPADAAVREAVEDMTIDLSDADSFGNKMTVVNSSYLRTLLSYVRATRAEAERDEARGRVEEMRDKVRRFKTRYEIPGHPDGELSDALDDVLALAECGEGE